MSNNKKELLQLLSNSRLAFFSQQNELALELAQAALKRSPNEPEAHKCAAQACMSQKNYRDAIKHYRAAVKFDPKNGDRCFDLGFAQVTAGNLAEAKMSLTRAENLGCAEENANRIHRILGMMYYDVKKYDESLYHFEKAEQAIGIDLDIMKRKAIICGLKEDAPKGLSIANQIKLIAPTEYLGYQLSFMFMVQTEQFESAEQELKNALEYVQPSMEFFTDVLTLNLEKHKSDNDEKHLEAALCAIDRAFMITEPSVQNVIECYITAADSHLKLHNQDKSIECINAALDPIKAFNSRVKVANSETKCPWFEVAPNSEYYLDTTLEVKHKEGDLDNINRIGVGAYTEKNDFEKMLEYAKKLQKSTDSYNSYIGKYSEARAMKELNLPGATKKYRELIFYFRNIMLKSPGNLAAAEFRIRCHMDIGEFDEAEQTSKHFGPKSQAAYKRVIDAARKEWDA